MDAKTYVITVGRSFGSGGRELGRRLAERLGISFYDKALLADAARQAGMSEDFFKRHDERQPSFLSGLASAVQGYVPLSAYTGPSALTGDTVYQSLSDFMHDLAARESCVIVGRTSDYVLRDHPRCCNIFVHAPLDHCVERIIGRGDCDTPEKARQLAVRTNKLRSSYYNFYTDKRWGDAASYHLTIDSSLLPMEDIVELIVNYLKTRGIVND